MKEYTFNFKDTGDIATDDDESVSEMTHDEVSEIIREIKTYKTVDWRKDVTHDI